jgi:class 3 adenylate cyclase
VRLPAAHDAAPANAQSFPGQNPNPVMRIALDGELTYANDASQPIRQRLGIGLGDRVPAAFLEQLTAGSRSSPPTPFELECELRTFAILAVPAGADGLNVYGTDVTGVKVVEKFPDRNPNPVLRVNPEGGLLYANAASATITRALEINVGDHLPTELHERIKRRLSEGATDDPIEVSGDGHTFSLWPVLIPEFGFINLYGTDVTALRAINKFPDENPNPVLRASHDGTLMYANPASGVLRRAFGAEVGDSLPAELFDRVRAIIEGRAPNVIEIEHEDHVFELRVVSLFEFESINLYGTDVTAARQVERTLRDNERLLLNILPRSIAERLRQGEEPIADAFDELGILFADVVNFTPYAATRQAHDVVALLNKIFSIFDRLADRHRVEKIKTIGDAYMVAGGLTPEGGAALDIAEMALDMIEGMRQLRTDEGIDMQIRAGLHIGPGIGGVIGLRKFSYDVWGDTVNTASRMQTHGIPGHIQVTSETAARYRDRYVFERRGVIDVKGKGPVETCFLVARRP